MHILSTPSPNHDSRGNTSVDMLVLHYTGMPTAEAALEKLRDPTGSSRVSAHYLVDEAGVVYQLVPESQRAWHAGVSSWRGHTDINARSIGIEIANPGHEYGLRPFAEAQMAAVAALCKNILARHAIPADNVVAHSDIAPTRKQDPGELFDWQGLAAQGIGIWPEARPQKTSMGTWLKALFSKNICGLIEGTNSAEVAALQQKLAQFGYGVPQHGSLDAETTATIMAFQRRFRPRKLNGIWDAECARLLDCLLGQRASATLNTPDGRMAANAPR